MNHIKCSARAGPVGVGFAILHRPGILFGVVPLDVSIGAGPQMALVISAVQTGE
jgi:hypothetical protein